MASRIHYSCGTALDFAPIFPRRSPRPPNLDRGGFIRDWLHPITRANLSIVTIEH